MFIACARLLCGAMTFNITTLDAERHYCKYSCPECRGTASFGQMSIGRISFSWNVVNKFFEYASRLNVWLGRVIFSVSFEKTHFSSALFVYSLLVEPTDFDKFVVKLSLPSSSSSSSSSSLKWNYFEWTKMLQLSSTVIYGGKKVLSHWLMGQMIWNFFFP